jgi:hypothetical protein
MEHTLKRGDSVIEYYGGRMIFGDEKLLHSSFTSFAVVLDLNPRFVWTSDTRQPLSKIASMKE